MRFRTLPVVLAAGCLVVGLCVVSRWAGFSALVVSFPETQAAPNNDFQKGRAFLQDGDAKRQKKDFTGAKESYDEAVKVFQNAGTRVFASAAQQMADLCAGMPLNMSKLKSGTYGGTERGYVGDITIELDVKSGKIRRFQVVSHKESRPLKSLDVVPHEIMERQSPSVDAVTGATITSCAVMSATFKALEKAK
jgi:uncharacterized protein with FMN-binding domain